MKPLAVTLIAMALVGCATPPTIIREPVEVKVSVPVPCIDKLPEKPVWAVDALLKGASLFDQGVAAMKELEQRRHYERELEAEMKACIK